MKVIIDIPDHIYRTLIETGKYGYYAFDAKKAIKKGKTLPKNHGRLIDISEYENYFNTAITYDDGDHIHSVYTNMIPTIIEADRGDAE